MLANFSQENLTLRKATVLRLAENVSEDLIDQINFRNPQDSLRLTFDGKHGIKLCITNCWEVNHLDKNKKRLIEPVLQKYAHVFHDEETNDFNSTNVVEHKIVVTDPTTIRRPQNRTLSHCAEKWIPRLTI
jgi:hypothetical protein